MVTNFEKEVARKKNERALKKKAWINTLCHTPTISHIESPTLLLLRLLSTSAVSYTGSFALLLPCFVPTLALLLLYLIPALTIFYAGYPTLVLPCPMPTSALSLPLSISLALRILK